MNVNLATRFYDENGDAYDVDLIETTLRDAVESIRGLSGTVEANSSPYSAEYPPRWITVRSTQDDHPYTCKDEERSLFFPDHMTGSSILRLCRLLRVMK